MLQRIADFFRFFRFNPRWPTEPVVETGGWNWLPVALSLVALAYLMLRLRAAAPQPRGVARWVGAVTGAFAVAVAAVAFSPLLAVPLALAVVGVEVFGTWRWKL